MKALQAPIQKQIFEIKVTLRGIKPPIWRRFQIAGDVTLRRLHFALQTIMGWTNSHLHLFQIGETRYSEFDLDDPWNEDMKDSTKFKLHQLVRRPQSRLKYEYDFGDSWEHSLLVEKILPAERPLRYPVCLAGKRRCPPEDCGGPWGYQDFLEAIGNPDHESHEENLKWIGGGFDPEEFDIEHVNRRLRGGKNFGVWTR